MSVAGPLSGPWRRASTRSQSGTVGCLRHPPLRSFRRTLPAAATRKAAPNLASVPNLDRRVSERRQHEHICRPATESCMQSLQNSVHTKQGAPRKSHHQMLPSCAVLIPAGKDVHVKSKFGSGFMFFDFIVVWRGAQPHEHCRLKRWTKSISTGCSDFTVGGGQFRLFFLRHVLGRPLVDHWGGRQFTPPLLFLPGKPADGQMFVCVLIFFFGAALSCRVYPPFFATGSRRAPAPKHRLFAPCPRHTPPPRTPQGSTSGRPKSFVCLCTSPQGVEDDSACVCSLRRRQRESPHSQLKESWERAFRQKAACRDLEAVVFTILYPDGKRRTTSRTLQLQT